MSVVIDEFEVVVDNPPPVPSDAAGSDAPAPPARPPATGLKPDEVRFLVDRRRCRAARLFAH